MKTISFSFLCAALALAQDAAPQLEALPRSRYPKLPGSCIMVLAGPANRITMLDGRSSYADALALSADRSSYRWAWVPEPKGGGATFKVPGDGKTETVVYRDYGIARPDTVKPLGVIAGETLVEVEINGGRGAAEGAESVAVTRLKVLEGTPGYAIKVAESVAALRARHEEQLRSKAAEIDALLEAGRKASIGDDKASGPRETETLTYLTWMTDSGCLEVRFQTRVNDGKYGSGGGPLNLSGGRWGSQWSVDTGMKAVVDKSGKAEAPVWSALVPSRRELPPFPSAPGQRR